MQPVEPLRPAAPWIGGKRLLAGRIISYLESIPHTGYAEPFIGMGGVFLRRRLRPKFEAINDLNADVATFFRVLQRHERALLEELGWRVMSRAEFDRLGRQDTSTLTDIERADRFFLLQRWAFSGKARGRTFAVTRETRFNVRHLAGLLDRLHRRLSGVVIEQLDWRSFLSRYDGEGMLFYLDPPYFGSEGDYGTGLFDAADFARLAEALAGLEARFILSINDTPEIRETFAAFHQVPVETKYTIGNADRGDLVRELLIFDREPPKVGAAAQGSLLE